MTWQPLGYEKWPEDKDDRMWYGFRFIKHSPDHFELHMIDAESDLFEGVEVTRRAYEKVIKKNAENAELYDSDGETARMPFFKLTEEDVQRLNNDW